MSLKEKINASLTDKDSRLFFQNLMVFILLTVISLTMMTVNLITKNNRMVTSTLIFAILNVINIGLLFLKGIARRIAEMLFVIKY